MENGTLTIPDNVVKAPAVLDSCMMRFGMRVVQTPVSYVIHLRSDVPFYEAHLILSSALNQAKSLRCF